MSVCARVCVCKREERQQDSAQLQKQPLYHKRSLLFFDQMIYCLVLYGGSYSVYIVRDIANTADLLFCNLTDVYGLYCIDWDSTGVLFFLHATI